jgi:hypothetical protein
MDIRKDILRLYKAYIDSIQKLNLTLRSENVTIRDYMEWEEIEEPQAPQRSESMADSFYSN